MEVAKFIVLFGLTVLVIINYVDATTTTHTLLGRNVVHVTEASQRCKNGKTTKVTTKVTGDLYILSGTRKSFSDKWKRRMKDLDREDDDEKGHIVASVLGGPIEQWNLMPQARSVNRVIRKENNILVRWSDFERWAQTELKKPNGAPVKFKIDIEYSAAGGCRPVAYGIDATSNAGGTGIRGNFPNSPDGSFAVTSQPSRKG